MYSNGQWPGHGQPETAEIFREIIEVMPQLPIGKLANATKAGLGKLKDIAKSTHTDDAICNPTTDRQQEALG